MTLTSPGTPLRLAVQGGLALLLRYSLIDPGGHDIRSKTVTVVATVLLLLISCSKEPLRIPSLSDPMFPLALFCIFGLPVSLLSVSLHDSLLQWVL
ncbi:MAG: hypothetical protein HYU64_21275, partial [Armatimonadetes bacterium]|nr:hypothetical protein [Armatimonadota bacterium]